MHLFHLFTVKPVEVHSHELHRVQYGDYYLFASSLQAAWDAIKDQTDVADAAEVWGSKSDDSFQITPATRLHQQEQAGQHRHWVRVQEGYKQLHSGPESLEQWADRRLAEYMRARVSETGARSFPLAHVASH